MALVLAACSSKQPGVTGPPTTESRGDGGGAGGSDGAAEKTAAGPATHASPAEELEALHARVDTAWAELEVLDDERVKAAAPEPGAAAARCDRIRGLADEICTLSERMCTLATEHADQPRYAQACTRSQETCRSARQAAERCPAV